MASQALLPFAMAAAALRLLSCKGTPSPQEKHDRNNTTLYAFQELYEQEDQGVCVVGNSCYPSIICCGAITGLIALRLWPVACCCK